MRDIQLGLQYNMTRMRHHDAYLNTLPGNSPVRKRTRHQVGLRLDWCLLRQDLLMSLFGFYSPSYRDSYVRGVANYRADDHWALEGGLNLFHGRHEHTFFGQLRDNSNGYLGGDTISTPALSETQVV